MMEIKSKVQAQIDNFSTWNLELEKELLNLPLIDMDIAPIENNKIKIETKDSMDILRIADETPNYLPMYTSSIPKSFWQAYIYSTASVHDLYALPEHITRIVLEDCTTTKKANLICGWLVNKPFWPSVIFQDQIILESGNSTASQELRLVAEIPTEKNNKRKRAQFED